MKLPLYQLAAEMQMGQIALVTSVQAWNISARLAGLCLRASLRFVVCLSLLRSLRVPCRSRTSRLGPYEFPEIQGMSLRGQGCSNQNCSLAPHYRTYRGAMRNNLGAGYQP